MRLEEKMISVICCFNRYDAFCTMRESLYTQNIKTEVIGVDNSKGRFPSAAAALNWGAEQANGDILVFLHQDIVFLREDSLARLVGGVQQVSGDAVAGIFGAGEAEQNTKIGDFSLCDTLDECCIAMRRTTWQRLKFNEDICDGWHLYVVEFCLRARSIKAVVCSNNCDIQHLSNGTVNEEYMKTFKKLLIEYKDQKWIRTTCKSMPTNLPVYYGYYFAWKLKKILVGNYPLLFSIRQRIKK